jgi:hypothetical protein
MPPETRPHSPGKNIPSRFFGKRAGALSIKGGFPLQGEQAQFTAIF